MVFLYVLIGLVGAAALVFAVQNPGPVSINFLNWQTVEMPLSLLLLLAVALGIVVASISAFATQIQLKLKIRRLEHQIAKLSTLPAKPLHRVEPRRVDQVLPGA
jgi:lipopolysaccharide assembly protein A